MLRSLKPLALLLAFAPGLAVAQDLGVGAQFGEPTGLTVRSQGAVPFDAAVGWDLDEGFSAQAHYLVIQRQAGADLPLDLFVGPGLFLESDDNDTEFGLSLNAGLATYAGPLEFFVQITPGMGLVPETEFRLGAGLGARFYF